MQKLKELIKLENLFNFQLFASNIEGNISHQKVRNYCVAKKTPLWRHHNGILWQGIFKWFAGQGGMFQAYLISSQSEFRAFRTISFLGALFHVLAPFRSLTITLFTSLVWTNFQHFPPPPLPPTCELIPNVFLFLVLVGGSFFPHLCWRDI